MFFSVVVPIYKVEEFLRTCVDSILKQTWTDFELLLVDDGSPDQCPQICDEYAAKDARVRVIHKKNGGLVSARNAGIAAARGDYICYVDGDDWIKPELLQFVRDAIQNAPAPMDIVCYGADIVYADHTDPLVNKVATGYYDKARLEKEVYPWLLTDRRNGFRRSFMITANAWNKVMRREFLMQHYVRDERIRMLEDGAFTYECLLCADHVYICSELLYCYNKMNPGAMTEGFKLYLNQNYIYVVEYLHAHIGNISPDIDRQLSDFAALLILWDVGKQLEITGSVFKAAANIRDSLRATGMLRFVRDKEIPMPYGLIIRMLRKGLYLPVMILKAIKR